MVLCLVGAGSSAQATDYHVSSAGDDAHPGTVSKPWKSIDRVNAADLAPGDRVLFDGGQTFGGTLQLEAQDSGADGRRVVIGSYGEGRAIIDGGDGAALVARDCSHLSIRGLDLRGSGRQEGNTANGLLLLGGSHLEVDALDVSGFQKSGVCVERVRDCRITRVRAHDNGAAGISCDGGGRGSPTARDLYIGHCIADNNPGDPTNLTNHSGNGIVVGCVEGCVIEYCEAMNNGWDMPRTGNGPVGIWAWNADRVIIQFCVAHDNKSPGYDGGGFDFDGGVTNSILQYNYSYNNDGPGYFLCQYHDAATWKDNIVRYNISVNDGIKNNVSGGCAIEVICDPSGGMSDAEIYNNVVYNVKGGAVGFGQRPVPRIRFRNNIFVTSEEMIKGDWSRARFEGNCWWSIGEGFRVPRGEDEWFESMEQWAQESGQEMIGGRLVGLAVDPLLTAPGFDDLVAPDALSSMSAYMLKPGSACVRAGIAIEDNGGRDFWGRPLPEKEAPAVGAYQPD